jgi:aminoacyl tRNA synthase complex-interacting multifunctional protein 1
MRDEKTGYLQTFPFEENNPMPEAFERTSEYLVKLLDPVIKPKNSEGGGEGGASTSQPSSSSNTNDEGDQKSKKKKEKVKKQSQPPQEEADPFAKANLTVGKVLEAKADDAWSEKLYLCKVLIGEDEEKDVKQVVTGLRKYVKREDLEGKLVLTIINLKVAKLAGETSEAMILATESGEGESVDVKLVKVPDGAKIGEKAFIENEEDKKPETYPKECKSKLWEQVKQTLVIKGGKATYQGKNVVVASGFVTGQDGVADGAFIK